MTIALLAVAVIAGYAVFVLLLCRFFEINEADE